MTVSRGRSGLNRAVLACLCALPLVPATVPGGARAQEAAFAVQDVTLRDVVLELAGTRVTAPLLTASGTGLSREALLAILSAAGQEPWSVRLARLDAASIAIPELRTERSAGGSRQVAVYRDVVAKGVHAGRIAELTAAGASLSVATPTGRPSEEGTPSGTGSYGLIRAEDADLAALARLATEPGDARAPWQRLVAAFSVANIAVANAQGTRVGLERIEGRDLSARQVPATWAGVWDLLKAFDPDDEDPAARARMSGTGADMLESVSVGRLEAVGLRIHDTVPTKDGNGRDEEPADLSVGRLAYAAAGPDAGLALSDIGATGAGVRLRLTKLGLSGFSLQPTVAGLRRIAAKAASRIPANAASNGGAKPPATSADTPAETGSSASDLRRLTPLIGTLTVVGLGLDLKPDAEIGKPASDRPSGDAKPAPSTRDPLAAKPLAAKPSDEPAAGDGMVHVALREGVTTFGPPQDGVPTASRISLQGLTLPASVFAGAPVLGSLGTYGYRALDLDLSADSAWNEAAREVALRDVSVTGRDMGSLHLSGVIGGVGADVFDPDAAIAGLAMLSATAKTLTLQIENGGLYERFIDATAKSLSLKPDELRKEYVTACLIGIPVILGNSPAAKAIGAAMGKFAAKPGTLSISAKARNGSGLGVVDFSTTPSPAAMLDKLDVTARAE